MQQTSARQKKAEVDRGTDGEMGGLGWLALTNLIPELIGMTDEDKLKWVS